MNEEKNKNEQLEEMLDNIDTNSSIPKVPFYKNKTFLLCISGVLLVSAIIGGSILLRPKTKPDENKKIATNNQTEVSTNTKSYEKLPVELPEVFKKPRTENPTKEEIKQVLSFVKESEVSMTTNVFPSKDTGYTNDTKKALDENGLPNEKYSYVLQEDWDYYIWTYANRFINPIYGNWTEGQKSGVVDLANFKDMYSPSAWELIEKDHKKLPVFADWNKDSYGNTKFDGDVKWIGEIVSTETEAGKDEHGATMKTTMKIKYKAYSNEKIIEKNATLKMELAPNYDNPEGNRVILKSATFTFDD